MKISEYNDRWKSLGTNVKFDYELPENVRKLIVFLLDRVKSDD